jgi:hypothetical protein
MISKELDNLIKVRLLKIEHGDGNEPAGLIKSGRKQAPAPDRQWRYQCPMERASHDVICWRPERL